MEHGYALPPDPEFGTTEEASPVRVRTRRGDGRRCNYWASIEATEFPWYPKPKPLPYLREMRLIEQAQQGDGEALARIWLQHARLAYSVVNEFGIPRRLVPDAVQEAVIGLYDAIKRFEIHKYNAFSTYAWHWMKQRVRRLLIKQRAWVRLPDYLAQDYIRFRNGLKRCRTIDEQLQWREQWHEADPKTYRRLCSYHRLAEAATLDGSDTVECPFPDPAVRFETDECRSIVRKVIAEMADGRYSTILTKRFGLDGNESVTLKEMGHALSLTRERIRQLQVDAQRSFRAAVIQAFDNVLPLTGDTVCTVAANRPADTLMDEGEA